MRIAIATDTYLPEINGVTTVLGTIRNGLIRRGYEILVIAPGYPEESGSEPGVLRRPSMRCPGYPAIRLAVPWAGPLRRELDGFAPDLVHAATEGPLGSIGRRWALQRGVPLVTSFHTDFPRYMARYAGDWAVEPTRRYLRRFHARARHTQTPSEVTRGELLALGIPRAVVWGRGVDTRWFTPARRSEVRRRERGMTDRLAVLHVGRLAVEKDIDCLIRAFVLSHEALGDAADFCVAGDGPRAEAVRRELPFARHLGFLDREALADLYADADLFVFPSPTETCGLVALEAMASGLPVIGADAGGVLENLRHGINGLAARAGDPGSFAQAVVELARDGATRGAMSQAARAFAAGRDWEGELDALERLYAAAAAPEPQVQHACQVAVSR
ncbi:MAG: glycosyltransferase family 4 protein [Gemmatimonadales bacterium]